MKLKKGTANNKTQKDRAKGAKRQQSHLVLESKSSFVASFPHTDESVSVSTFQNSPLNASSTPQSTHVQNT